MTGGQDWANEDRQIESTGEKLTIEERTRRGIEHCNERIEYYTRLKAALEGEHETC